MRDAPAGPFSIRADYPHLRRTHHASCQASPRRVMVDVVEASIADLRAALESGATTAVEVVEAHLARIERFDRTDTATALNSVVVRAPDARAQAAAADVRRRSGAVLGPLDGIPYVAKDSYLVEGLTAAAGSPAFADVVAQHDAFTIGR